MPTSTVTSKGQVTIPKAIREALNLKPGDEVLFVPHHDGTVELVARNLSLDEFLARVRAIVPPWEGPPVSIEEMNEAMADYVAEDVMRSLGHDARGAAERPEPAPAPRRPRRRAA